MGGEVAGRAAIARAVQERAERGVDVVKVMASGGMNTPGTDVMRTQFTDDELEFLVEHAHGYGLPVTAHAHGLPAVEQALRAGVDALEHCSCLTETGVRITDELLDDLARRALPVGPRSALRPRKRCRGCLTRSGR
jgi:imidazolonepropionase-like amidohydrolase